MRKQSLDDALKPEPSTKSSAAAGSNASYEGAADDESEGAEDNRGDFEDQRDQSKLAVLCAFQVSFITRSAVDCFLAPRLTEL